MPVVLRVSLGRKGMRIEAWGVRGDREELYNALEWEKLMNGAGGEAGGELVESPSGLPVARDNGSRRGRR